MSNVRNVQEEVIGKNKTNLPDGDSIKKLVDQGDITLSQALIRITKQHANFFITENHEVFASIRVNGIEEHYDVAGQQFQKLVRMLHYKIFDNPLSKHTLKESIETIIALEEFNFNKTENTFIRVAGDKNTIYLDLCTINREVIKIDENGWEIITESPVKFIRPKTFRALPIPDKNGSITELDKFLNIEEKDRILIYSFLIGCLSPTGPYPILVLQGSHGSGKSFFSKVIKSLIDPSFAPIKSIPKNEEDLLISAQNSHLLAFDNLSGLSNSMSDSLCKLSTGGGLTKRKLFNDKEEVVFSTTRPIILNGIDYIARRPDLADRSIIVNLLSIDDTERRKEAELLEELENLRPKIFGALLDAVSIGLKNYKSTKLEFTPRMADFAIFASAAETGFGFEQGTFIKQYLFNRKDAAEEAVEHDLLLSTIINCLEKQNIISGNATEILKILGKYITAEDQSSKQWIKSSNQVKNQLIRLQPILAANNIKYEYHRNNRGRIHTLKKINIF